MDFAGSRGVNGALGRVGVKHKQLTLCVRLTSEGWCGRSDLSFLQFPRLFSGNPASAEEVLGVVICRLVHNRSQNVDCQCLTPRWPLENGPRPTVAVRISENHIGAPATDPAAETEWIRALQRAGFMVHDRQSKEPADLTLSGEAFSTFGVPKGNLVACRARLEIRIHETRSGRLRLADRQTSVPLDIAEPIAAKAALQEAALTVAERVIPRLTP